MSDWNTFQGYDDGTHGAYLGCRSDLVGVDVEVHALFDYVFHVYKVKKIGMGVMSQGTADAILADSNRFDSTH